jgi:hypothetical protein
MTSYRALLPILEVEPGPSVEDIYGLHDARVRPDNPDLLKDSEQCPMMRRVFVKPTGFVELVAFRYYERRLVLLRD